VKAPDNSIADTALNRARSFELSSFRSTRPRESGDPERLAEDWIPACAGMSDFWPITNRTAVADPVRCAASISKTLASISEKLLHAYTWIAMIAFAARKVIGDILINV
jgi:hypothetical protein